MNLDAAAIWLATRSEADLKKAREAGLSEDLFQAHGKVAWKFISTYRDEYGQIPSPSIISENSGLHIRPIEEGVSLDYILDQMHDRAIWRALRYGGDKFLERMEEADAPGAIDEVCKLADHLRSRRGRKAKVLELRDIVHLVGEQYERTKRGEIGVPFPWPTMTEMTLGMWPGTLTFFVARPGVGKCVHEDTEITDPVTGVPMAIKDVFRRGEQTRVVSWSREKGVHVTEITQKVDTGHKECLRFTLRTGRVITVTPEHPFMTPEGWVRADELVRGSSVGIPSRMPFPEQPVRSGRGHTDVDLLALMSSCGYVDDGRIGISTVSESIALLGERVADALGVSFMRKSWCDFDFVGKDENHVARVLEEYGFVSPDKIPDSVFRLPRADLARFMSVFWMACAPESEGADVSAIVSRETVARQIQSLLLRFGVQSRVSRVDVDGGAMWRLVILAEYAGAFVDIPVWGHVLERAREIASSVARSSCGAVRISDEWAGKMENAGALGVVGDGGEVDVDSFRELTSAHGLWDEYRWWIDSGLHWDEVTSIESAGVQKVYDLTVDETRCFVANDILVHNTWTAINICWNAWENENKRVLIVSPEMGKMELAERIVSRHGQIAYGDLISATLGSMGGEKQLLATIRQLEESEGFFVLEDERMMNPTAIEEAIEATNPDIVAVDSMYMLRVEQGKVKSGPGSKGGRYDRILGAVDWLRSLCRRTQKPFLGISQLSRDAKMKKGAAERLKRGVGTGGLEDAVAMSDTLFMDAHNLFAMFQDDDMKLDKQMMYVPLKLRRQAKRSSIVTKWDMTAMEFDEIGTRVESGGDFNDDGYNDVSF